MLKKKHGEMRNAYKSLVRKSQGCLGDLGVVGSIISKWILENKGVNVENGFNCLRTGSNGEIL
jgi:uncharacterized membrane protein YeaQ/YmgE (transglycosylase-associated protein family)